MGPESIFTDRGYGFRVHATQVGYSLLGHFKLPISGKPEIGGVPRNDGHFFSIRSPNHLPALPRFGVPEVTAVVRAVSLSCGKAGYGRVFAPVRESSGESRFKQVRDSSGESQLRTRKWQHPVLANVDPVTNTFSHSVASRFLLLGDSHTVALVKAAREQSIPFSGGALSVGRELNVDFFERSDRDLVFRDPSAQKRYRRYLSDVGVEKLGDIAIPVVSTVGFNCHTLAAKSKWQHHTISPDPERVFISRAMFEETIRTMVRGSIAFYEYLMEMRIEVVAIMPPQRAPQTCEENIYFAAQDVILTAFRGVGVPVIDIRDRVVDEHGLARPEYFDPNDDFHGNVRFGNLILQELVRRQIIRV